MNGLAPTLKAISDFIGAVGFPAFVAVVLLYQVHGMHKENSKTMRHLAHELAQLRKMITGEKARE